MARKPTPDHLKIIKGTARPDRMNPDAPAPNNGIAEAPAWLSDRASELFAQLSATLDGMGIASPDDAMALSLLASRIEEVELMTAALEDGGRTYDTIGQGGAQMRRAAPEVGMRNEAMRHAHSLLSEFGLSPSARSKVSAGKAASANPFAALG
jgi:P27 family predicted phage terminase small subunit